MRCTAGERARRRHRSRNPHRRSAGARGDCRGGAIQTSVAACRRHLSARSELQSAFVVFPFAEAFGARGTTKGTVAMRSKLLISAAALVAGIAVASAQTVSPGGAGPTQSPGAAPGGGASSGGSQDRQQSQPRGQQSQDRAQDKQGQDKGKAQQGAQDKQGQEPAAEGSDHRPGRAGQTGPRPQDKQGQRPAARAHKTSRAKVSDRRTRPPARARKTSRARVSAARSRASPSAASGTSPSKVSRDSVTSSRASRHAPSRARIKPAAARS